MKPKFTSRIMLYVILSLTSLAFITFAWISTPHSGNESLNDTILTTEASTYELRWTHTISGQKDNTPGELRLAAIPQLTRNMGAIQDVLEQTFTPAPDKYISDEQGNTSAIYQIRALPPGQQFQVHHTAKVRLTNITVFIDADLCQECEQLSNATTSANALDQATQSARCDNSNWYTLVRLYDSVRQRKFELQNEPRSLKALLQGGTLQCEDASRLLVALCQNCGLPAQQISGQYLAPERANTLTYHSWVAIKLPTYGWIMCDPTMGRFPETRQSRLGQLDNAYLTLWIGAHPEGISVYSGPGQLRNTFSHRLLQRVPHSSMPSSATQYTNPYIAKLRQICSTHPAIPIKRSNKATAVNIPSDGPSTTNSKNNSSVTPSNAYTDKETYQRLVLLIEKGLYLEAAHDISILPTGYMRNQLEINLMQRTKQLPKLWSVLTQSLDYGFAPQHLELPLQLCADSADWRAMQEIASCAHTLYPDNIDFTVALAQAEYHLGHKQKADVYLDNVHKRCRDGYAEAIRGTLSIYDYQHQEALKHWQQALQLGLNPDESAYYRDLILDVQSHHHKNTTTRQL